MAGDTFSENATEGIYSLREDEQGEESFKITLLKVIQISMVK